MLKLKEIKTLMMCLSRHLNTDRAIQNCIYHISNNERILTIQRTFYLNYTRTKNIKNNCFRKHLTL